MKKLFLISLLCILCGAAQAQKIKIKTGIEVLKEQNFKCLEGKRVGLITNPTGVDNQLKSTIDILHEAPNVNLVALYGPEHGVRGDVHAGDHVTDIKDATTGLPVYSLYGKTRKATPEMLKDVENLILHHALLKLGICLVCALGILESYKSCILLEYLSKLFCQFKYFHFHNSFQTFLP